MGEGVSKQKFAHIYVSQFFVVKVVHLFSFLVFVCFLTFVCFRRW